MTLHVVGFGGGIAVEGSADTQRTDEVQVADSVDIGSRGALVATTGPSDYLVLDDNTGVPVPWVKFWALLETAGFNFSKVFAVGEGDVGAGVIRYIFACFNREGEVSPLAYVAGSVFPPAVGGFPVLANGVSVLGSDFAGIYWISFNSPGAGATGVGTAARFYFVNIGAREGTAPVDGAGLFAVDFIPPATAPFANEIRRFDALGTGSSGSLTVPTSFKDGEGGATAGTNGRQLYFRGIIAYNNHMFGWGYDASDDRQVAIGGITNAANGVVTANAHGFQTGDIVRIRGVGGMVEVNGRKFTITVTGANTFQLNVDTSAYGVYIAGADDFAATGNGDGPNRVMFSNLGRPLKWGNDRSSGAAGTDRAFTDSDAIVLGDAGELIRAAIVWEKTLIFGTNKGLHLISGYGRDSFISDGATPVMRSYNVVGPHALIEGPDKALYGVCEQGLWVMSSLGSIPKPLFQQLRDFGGRSNGYWDLMWTDVSRGSTYPGVTNQDLVWMAIDWERQQVIIGIPWCSIANGYGYGTDTVVLKYHVATGGFTRQQFTGVQYTAAGYFRALAGQAAGRFLGTATAGKSTVQRYGYKATNNATPVLPAVKPVILLGPYAPFGPDGRGTVRRLYAVVAWDPYQTTDGDTTITAITQANPAAVTTLNPHGLSTGQQVDIWGVNNMMQIVNGPYTITVTGANTFTLDGINSTGFTAYGGATNLHWGLPLAFTATLKIDDTAVKSTGAGEVSTFQLYIRELTPITPTEGDLWVDTSNLDPNLGNATAGNILPSQPGYLCKVRRDNSPVAITGATKANPCVITAPTHGLITGQRVSIRDVAGMTQLNNTAGAGPYLLDYTIIRIDADHFSLVGVDSSAYGVYTSGGRVCLAWLLVPGLGGNGQRASIPIPVTRKKGTRLTLNLSNILLTRRFQLEGFGQNPGGGVSAT